MNIKIRLATIQDAEQLADIIASYWLEGRASFPEDNGRSYARQLLRNCMSEVDNHAVYVAEEDSGALCGYVTVHWIPFPLLHGIECYISDLVVGASSRGKGIGTRLLAVVEAEARRKGCCRLMLNNRHDSVSFKRGFYIKAGFAERTGFSNFVKTLDRQGRPNDAIEVKQTMKNGTKL
jgi:GNAT superfamily N-acetyltransferase